MQNLLKGTSTQNQFSKSIFNSSPRWTQTCENLCKINSKLGINSPMWNQIRTTTTATTSHSWNATSSIWNDTLPGLRSRTRCRGIGEYRRSQAATFASSLQCSSSLSPRWNRNPPCTVRTSLPQRTNSSELPEPSVPSPALFPTASLRSTEKCRRSWCRIEKRGERKLWVLPRKHRRRHCPVENLRILRFFQAHVAPFLCSLTHSPLASCKVWLSILIFNVTCRLDPTLGGLSPRPN